MSLDVGPRQCSHAPTKCNVFPTTSSEQPIHSRYTHLPYSASLASPSTSHTLSSSSYRLRCHGKLRRADPAELRIGEARATRRCGERRPRARLPGLLWLWLVLCAAGLRARADQVCHCVEPLLRSSCRCLSPIERLLAASCSISGFKTCMTEICLRI